MQSRYPTDHNSGFVFLNTVCRPLKFEPHAIADRLNQRGYYQEDLTGEFPLLIRLFHYASGSITPGLTWHERLEIFVPLDGEVHFRMGGRIVTLNPGDALVVDNLKLHEVRESADLDTRAIVISFLPDFVFSLGSPVHDYALLLPFYPRVNPPTTVLRVDDPLSATVLEVVGKLLQYFFGSKLSPQARQTGSKASLLQLLFFLTQRFGNSDVLQSELMAQQERTVRLRPLFEHIIQHGVRNLTLDDAARMVSLKRTVFTRVFKRVAGTTFVDYLHHVRLTHATRLLRESSLTIAEIAHEIGYVDQGYFDRRFKMSFGLSPRQYRISVLRQPDSQRSGGRR